MSNRGPPFDSYKFKEFVKNIIEIKLNPSTAELNGLSERYVQTGKKCIIKNHLNLERACMMYLLPIHGGLLP